MATHSRQPTMHGTVITIGVTNKYSPQPPPIDLQSTRCVVSASVRADVGSAANNDDKSDVSLCSYGLCSYGLYRGADMFSGCRIFFSLPVVSTLKSCTQIQGKWSFRFTLSPTMQKTRSEYLFLIELGFKHKFS